MIQVLFAFSSDDILRSVAWLEGDFVKRRILATNGETFERGSSSQSLNDEWRRFEGLYSFFRPALVPSLAIAFEMLGRHVDVLDDVPPGTLAPPRHWVLGR